MKWQLRHGSTSPLWTAFCFGSIWHRIWIWRISSLIVNDSLHGRYCTVCQESFLVKTPLVLKHILKIRRPEVGGAQNRMRRRARLIWSFHPHKSIPFESFRGKTCKLMLSLFLLLQPPATKTFSILRCDSQLALPMTTNERVRRDATRVPLSTSQRLLMRPRPEVCRAHAGPRAYSGLAQQQSEIRKIKM